MPDDAPLETASLETASRLARGIASICEPIARTLGPMSRDDARTVVERFVTADPGDEPGAACVREMVREQLSTEHDGAATACVLASAMAGRIIDALRAGADPTPPRARSGVGAKRVIEELPNHAQGIQTKEQLAALITTSTGDPAIAGAIAEAMDKVGKEGAIAVEESGTADIEVELSQGTRIGKGCVAPPFVSGPESFEAVLEDPYILIADATIPASQELQLLDEVAGSGKPLLIIAGDVAGEAFATQAIDQERGLFKSVVVEAPGFGDSRADLLGDIAILTGGQPGRPGWPGQVGRARKVIVTKDETLIVGAAGDERLIRDRISQIMTEIRSAGSFNDREQLQERLARLAGGAAVIKVGAVTQAAHSQRKELMKSAVALAAKAAEWGIVPGGGKALLEVQRQLAAGRQARRPRLRKAAPAEAAGMAIVVDSLGAPFRQILTNAGLDPAKLERSAHSWKPGTGFDVSANERRDMWKAGIIDSQSVIRQAVLGAAALAQRLITG